MAKPKPSIQVSVRLDADLVATIEKAAEQERRTMADCIRLALEDAFQPGKHGTPKFPPARTGKHRWM